MSLPPKLLWEKGLGLEAQHFQQQDRYHEARLQHLANALNPHIWGVQSVTWDESALANNLLGAEHMSLIFQTGDIYQAPTSDALPLPIDLSELPADEQNFTFYAALPILKAHGGNVSRINASLDDARYTSFTVQTADLHSDGTPTPVSHVRKAVRLLSYLEPHKGYDCIPVVKLSRRVDGSFVIAPDFIPPCVTVKASPVLERLLFGVLAKVATKIDALYQLQRRPNGHTVEAHSGGSTSFSMLGALTTIGANLTIRAKAQHCHPEVLFDWLATFAGALMAFSTKYALNELPAYLHEDPAPGFATLAGIISELLDTVVSSRLINIPLESEKRCFWNARLDAELADSDTPLYLAVRADMPALELVEKVPRFFKIGTPNSVETLVGHALPGAELLHMAQVPVEVPVRPNTYYFSLVNKDEHFQAARKERTMTIYASLVFKELEIELFAIRT